MKVQMKHRITYSEDGNMKWNAFQPHEQEASCGFQRGGPLCSGSRVLLFINTGYINTDSHDYLP